MELDYDLENIYDVHLSMQDVILNSYSNQCVDSNMLLEVEAAHATVADICGIFVRWQFLYFSN